jgi:hypothetical protein
MQANFLSYVAEGGDPEKMNLQAGWLMAKFSLLRFRYLLATED